MKKVLTSMALMLALAASFAVFAQQTKDAPQAQGTPQAEGQGRRMGRMRGMRAMHPRMRRHGHAMRAFAQLNLSDAQKERMRSIHESARAGTQSRREELRQIFMTRRQGGQLTPEQQARARQLRDELREARKRTRDEALGVLTTEQRAQLDRMKEERKTRREQMRTRRKQMREGTGQQPPQN